ncbi:hypothetical protein SPFM7_00237 [Salmonella phage SPFM7]|nr:hypothetical protein SPFM7_00237 [Salmonella phage SPFM7]
MSYYWRKARAVTDSINYVVPPARDGIGITHEIFKIELVYGCTGYYPGNYERAEMDTMRITTEVDVDTPAPLLTEYNVFLLKTNLDVDRNDELIINNTQLAYINGTLVGRQGSERVWESLSDDQVFAQISFSPRNADGKKTAEGYILRTVTKSEPPYQGFVSTNVTTELSVVTADYQIDNKSCDVRIYQLDKPQLNSKLNAGNTNRYLFTPFHYVVDISLQIDAEMTILAKTMRKEDLGINGNRLTIEPDTLYRFTDTRTITAPLYFSWDELVKLPTVPYFLTAPMPESTLSKVSSPIATVSDYGLTLSKPNDYVTGRSVVNNAVGIRKLPVTEKQLEEEGSYATGGRTQLSFDELRDQYDAGYINPLKSFSIKMLVAVDVSAFPADEYTFSLRDLNGENLVSGEIRMDVYTTIGPLDPLIQVVNQSIRCTIPSIYMATWTEIHHTHSRDVYDPNTPTGTFTNKFFYARVWNKPSNSNKYSVKDENDTLLGQNTFVMTQLTSVPSTPSQILAIRIPVMLWITETQSPISPVTTNALDWDPIEIRVLPYGTVDNPAFQV